MFIIRWIGMLPLVLSIVLQDARALAISVNYEVVFDATWNAEDFPEAFPVGAHFSPLVGGAHNSGITFWEVGGNTTLGIERMAEVGATSTLVSEVDAAITQGTATSSFVGSGLFNLPTSTTLLIEVEETHPLVTLVSMVAPSPDWFVGVSGLSLLENGAWIGQRVVDLFPYDAGTEEGLAFSTSNLATSPHQPISLIDGIPFGGLPSLGTFTFTVLPNGLPGDFDLNGEVNELDATIWQSNFGAFTGGGAFVVDGDADGDGDVDGRDFLLAQRNHGTSLSGLSAPMAVPEPSSAPLAILTATLFLLSRARMARPPGTLGK